MLKHYVAHFRARWVDYEFGSVKAIDISTAIFAENRTAALKQAMAAEQLDFLKDNQNIWICNIKSSKEKKIVLAGSADEAAEKARLGRRNLLVRKCL